MKNNKNKKNCNPLPLNLVGLVQDDEKQGTKWNGLKQHNQDLQETVLQCSTPKIRGLSKRLADCSTFLEFAKGGQKWRLSKASFCKFRWCPVCQWRRSLVWQKRFINALPKVEEKHPNGRWIFLTLTVRNCEPTEIKATLKHMQQAFKRLTLLKAWPGVGWVRSVEITRNADDNTAHPHIHALILVKPSYFQGSRYITQAKWGEMWKECLRVDYSPVVDVRAVKAKKGTDLNPIQSAILETFKYSVKPSDLTSDPEFFEALHMQTRNTRAIGLGGCLKEFVKDTEEDLNELEGVEIEDEQKLFYLFYPVWKQYARKA